jgi:hypothetical protein
MNNRLLTSLAAASLISAAGALTATKPAQAASTGFGNLDQFQFNADAVFFDADPGPGNALNVLFRLSTADDAPGGAPDYATNGNYGNISNVVNAGTTGGFTPYETAPVSGLQILSVALPSLVPTVSGGENIYIGPGGTIPSLPGSALTPPTNFPAGTPFLNLTAGGPNDPAQFFVDSVVGFKDNVPGPNLVKEYNITLNGTWKDNLGNDLGQGIINGTFGLGTVGGTPVDNASGDLCTTPGVGTCVPGTSSSFGGTFIVQQPSQVPEPATLSALVAFGALGASSALLKRKG